MDLTSTAGVLVLALALAPAVALFGLLIPPAYHRSVAKRTSKSRRDEIGEGQWQEMSEAAKADPYIESMKRVGADTEELRLAVEVIALQRSAETTVRRKHRRHRSTTKA